MKRIFAALSATNLLRTLGLVVATVSCMQQANAATTDVVYQDSHTIICGPEGVTFSAQTRGEQGRYNTNVVLQGLANTMTEVGKIVTAKDAAEQKQGFFGVLSSILSTIALLVMPRITSREAGNEVLDIAQLNARYVDDVSSLIQSVHDLAEPTKNASVSTLDQFKDITNTDERKALLTKIFEDDSMHSVFIADLCAATYQTLLRIAPDFVPQLNQAIQELLHKLAAEQVPATIKATAQTKNAGLEGVGVKRKPAKRTAALA